MKAQHCFPVLTFDKERYVVATTSEGFSTSGNAVVTSQEHAARTEVTYNLLEDMNGLAAISQLCKGQLTCVHLPSTTMGSRRLSKNGKQTHWAKSLLWVPAGRGERQIAHSTSYLLK